ncbi:hypothetical protein GIB67_001975 [Kingdonia uniflora]|uniref:Uncharacterized protein n=1 Tax=Kingdonia uniflora TaxID=39325 RepID=A0A7J7MA34_9MAGN|nr:hypothetical protein GIB67_001975 [Kingdonia uniflora]
MQPPRSETQTVITDLEKEITMLVAENTAASRTLELRKKQFSLLLHVIRLVPILYGISFALLKVSMNCKIPEDVQKSLVEELRIAMEEQKNSLEDANGISEAMTID